MLCPASSFAHSNTYFQMHISSGIHHASGLRASTPALALSPACHGAGTVVRRCQVVVASTKQNPHVQTPNPNRVTVQHEKASHQSKGFAPSANQLQHQPHAHISSASGARLMAWMEENGAPQQAVELKSIEPPLSATDGSQHHRPLDMLVARRSMKPGDVALDVPENLVISLERVFESEFVAELLTTDKLSELACLTLFLMYEKKLREESWWHPYIKELDRQRARGIQAVESPLLWDANELEELLAGSPLLNGVKQRLQGIEREYKELDTVWYMSRSLFTKYPFDLPTETFSFERFKQAFSAVQASIVHLQGVPPSRRFSLVPLGPPLLCYSSISKAMLTWNEASRSVQLVVDREYAEGEPITAWCGPQPNSRLLLNYGIVDEHNPYDKLQLTAVLGINDPLFQAKRAMLQAAGLSTSQAFDLTRKQPLPPLLLPYMRLAAATTTEQAHQVSFDPAAHTSSPLDDASEAAVKGAVVSHLRARMAAYKRTIAEDEAVIADPHASQRRKVAARLTKIEKGILQAALDQLGTAAEQGGTQLPNLKLT